jgi:hypothetical protein
MLNNYHNIEIEASYPQPISIALDDAFSLHTSASKINTHCQSTVRAYLQQHLGLTVDLAYPTNIQFIPLISQLVTGFVLIVANTRIVFIPSEDLDYCGFEIEQEWVDLSNWAADYYVPVQVDLEGKFLNLWGFISHRDVQAKGEFDRISRTYIIDSQYISDDLDELWLTCELIASQEMSPERGAVLPVPELLPQTAQELIDILRENRSIFSPRLDLDFAQWGGILDRPKYLELYLNLAPEAELGSIALTIPRGIVRLSDWLDGQSAAIYKDWKSIREFFATPQLSAEYRSINLVEQLTICPQHNLMYRNTATNTQNLVEIIQNTNSQNERWDAIESLWERDPYHSALPIYKLLDLGLFFRGEQLSLLVSILPTKTGKLGILIRLSPNQVHSKLPLGIQLSRFDEDGKISRQVIAKDNTYQYLQLIFDADFGDKFSICVTLNDNQLTKHFQV